MNPSIGEQIAFWILAILAVGGALLMITSRKAVYAALWLAQTMIVLAVMYIMQGALFLGIVQIVVYTGAVMMLFLFVLMLVGVDASDSLVETLRGQRVVALLVGVGFGLMVIAALSRAALGDAEGITAANEAAGGNVQGLAELMFTKYVWAFEVTSALLITAAVSAMVLTHQERVTAKPTQRVLSEDRFRSENPLMRPAPGVYARHNAVDTPALLPDGSIAQDSLPPSLVARGDIPQSRPIEPLAERGAVPAPTSAVEVVPISMDEEESAP